CCTGLPGDKLEFYKQAKTEITYSREGDQWTINVGIVGIPNGSRVFKFALGQPYDSVNIDGTPLKSMITFENGSFVEQHKEAGPKESEMRIIRKVDGDRMEVQTTMGGATMTSIYVRS
ncbi:fatty acid-binding protein homolog 6-like, partial [Littorina saxatilis]|uniref:fatty acid-binding protein homolog 6-like n=1 Tax=Littorina saxatilis TaxID=31220 RepID=UPI0038B41AB0